MAVAMLRGWWLEIRGRALLLAAGMTGNAALYRRGNRSRWLGRTHRDVPPPPVRPILGHMALAPLPTRRH